MKIKKITAIILMLCLLCAPLLTACGGKGSDACTEKYVILQYTDMKANDVNYTAPEINYIFGENQKGSNTLVGVGYMGPMLLTQSIEQMNEEIETAFDFAEQYNIPIYFQLDDVNNYTDSFGAGAAVKYWEDPSMSEWIAFPEEGEEWGGQKYAQSYKNENGEELPFGGLPRFWYDWGDMRVAKPFPNIASPALKELVVNNLKEGVLNPLVKRYNKLKKAGKAYLFAGMAIGWETHIPNTSGYVGKKVTAITGEVMGENEKGQYGYSALYSLGYNQAKLDAEYAMKGYSSAEEYMKEILYGAIHDYTELLAKTTNDAGIPKEKIYSHIVSMSSIHDATSSWPPIWTAVNDYCTPGFTMNRQSCQADISEILKQISQADSSQSQYGLVEGYDWSYENLSDAEKYLDTVFDSGSRIITCFGWPNVKNKFDTLNNGYVRAVLNWKKGVWETENTWDNSPILM